MQVRGRLVLPGWKDDKSKEVCERPVTLPITVYNPSIVACALTGDLLTSAQIANAIVIRMRGNDLRLEAEDATRHRIGSLLAVAIVSGLERLKGFVHSLFRCLAVFDFDGGVQCLFDGGVVAGCLGRSTHGVDDKAAKEQGTGCGGDELEWKWRKEIISKRKDILFRLIR